MFVSACFTSMSSKRALRWSTCSCGNHAMSSSLNSSKPLSPTVDSLSMIPHTTNELSTTLINKEKGTSGYINHWMTFSLSCFVLLFAKLSSPVLMIAISLFVLFLTAFFVAICNMLLDKIIHCNWYPHSSIWNFQQLLITSLRAVHSWLSLLSLMLLSQQTRSPTLLKHFSYAFLRSITLSKLPSRTQYRSQVMQTSVMESLPGQHNCSILYRFYHTPWNIHLSSPSLVCVCLVSDVMLILMRLHLPYRIGSNIYSHLSMDPQASWASCWRIIHCGCSWDPCLHHITLVVFMIHAPQLLMLENWRDLPVTTLDQSLIIPLVFSWKLLRLVSPLFSCVTIDKD